MLCGSHRTILIELGVNIGLPSKMKCPNLCQATLLVSSGSEPVHQRFPTMAPEFNRGQPSDGATRRCTSGLQYLQSSFSSTTKASLNHCMNLPPSVKKQVGCRGDDDGDSARSTSSLNMTVEVDPRASARRVALEAIIRGGALEAAEEVTRSPPVSVSIWV